jgi:uncharacterized membrane protein YhaH (DUF805 family)
MHGLPTSERPLPPSPAPEDRKPRAADWVWLFAGFNGRLDLVTYRLALCLVLALVGAVSHWTWGDASVRSSPDALIRIFTDTWAVIPAAFALFALAVKRCHDMDWHGASALMIFVPIAGLAFLFVLLCAQDGTAGPNRYGPDPKARPAGDRRFTLVRGGRE